MAAFERLKRLLRADSVESTRFSMHGSAKLKSARHWKVAPT